MFIHNLLLEFIIGIILIEILSFTESKSCKKGVGHRYSVSDRLSYDEAIKNCNKGNRKILTVKNEAEFEEYKKILGRLYETDHSNTDFFFPVKYNKINDKFYFADGQEGNNWIREMVSKVKNFDTVVNSENWIDFCFGIPADYPDKISIYFCPAKFYAACVETTLK
ncbi:UNVERIFIED_CONTAM: hypothetical protein RMT77_014967 [Armadillidium vulgare]